MNNKKSEDRAMTENEQVPLPQPKLGIYLCRLFFVLALIPLGYFVLAVFVELAGHDVEWMITPAYYYITPVFGFIPTFGLFFVAARSQAKGYVISALIVLLMNMGLLWFEHLLLIGYSC